MAAFLDELPLYAEPPQFDCVSLQTRWLELVLVGVHKRKSGVPGARIFGRAFSM
jgi:hypothetical protein